MRLLKWLLLILGSIVVLVVLAGVLAYFSVEPPQPVPATVTDDPGLPRIELTDTVLHGEAFGPEGAPVVIGLHGGPGGDYRNILPLKALADDYRIVFYDQRGSGLSERVEPAQITVENFYRDLDGIIEKFSPEQPVHLIGHSWGAMLAAGYLGRHPERVAGAVLIEPGLLNPETGAIYLKKTNNMQPPLSAAVLKIVISSWLKSLHIDGPDPQAAVDYLALAIMTSDVPGHPLAGYYCGGDTKNAARETWRFGALASSTMMAEGMNKRGEFTVDFSKELHRYTREVLILAGSCNTIIGEEQQKMHRNLFPNARLEVIDGVGHTMPAEAPERVVPVIRDYLTKSGSRS